MKDGVIANTGNSRMIKANFPETYNEFKILASNGQLPVDLLFNALGWEMLPTFLNKNSLLKDTTTELFGLNKNAVPDDVLRIVAPNNLVNMHIWGKYATGTEYYLKQTYKVTNKQNFTPSSHDYMQYYTEASIVDGQIVLSGSHPVDYTEMVGCYYLYTSGDTSEYRRVKSVSTDNSPATLTYYNITVEEKATGSLVEYVANADQYAYPPSESDGYDYVYLGVLGGACHIEIGSYLGTGTYGSDNKNSLTFDVEPKILIIGCDNNQTGWQRGCFPWIKGLTHGLSGISGTTSNTVTLSWGKTVSWYSSSAVKQLNSSEQIYFYYALC